MEFRNRKFRIMDSVYSIKFVDRVPLMENQDPESVNFGVCNVDKKEILIGLKDSDGNPYREEQVMNTLRHELMHIVMFEGQYNNCYNDEPLIEWLAKSLGVLLKQKVLY